MKRLLKKWVTFIRGYKEPVVVTVPFGALGAALTVFPFTIYFGNNTNPTPGMKAHELVHWREQRRTLVVPWLVAYGLLALFYGVTPKHPMERYAYAVGSGLLPADL